MPARYPDGDDKVVPVALHSAKKKPGEARRQIREDGARGEWSMATLLAPLTGVGGVLEKYGAAVACGGGPKSEVQRL